MDFNLFKGKKKEKYFQYTDCSGSGLQHVADSKRLQYINRKEKK